MNSLLQDRIIALAAMTQACQCVQQIALTGITDSDAFTTCIKSIFAIDADSAEAIYGGEEKLLPGLQLLADLLDNKRSPANLEITRYIFSSLNLERRLDKKPAIQEQLGVGIKKAQLQAEHYAITHANVLANLADVYSNTLGTLSPRIMVNGEQLHLDNTENVNRIRALLLSSIRAAVLWRQKKGTRLQLFFQRKTYLVEINQLIRQANNR